MPAGRPHLDLDPVLIADLASIGCTMKEIASICRCSVDTLERNFADVIEKGREDAKVSLRRMQWKAAEGGSTGMLIWLGKQMLGQGDRIAADLGLQVIVEHIGGNQDQVAAQAAALVVSPRPN